MRRMFAFVLEKWVLVLALVGILIGVGMWAMFNLPIDAVPDLTNVQVQINTSAPALSPLEVERQITFPIEVATAGLPDVEEVRSLSRFGLSQVTVAFKDHVNIYFARQLVQERLQVAKEDIPPGLGTPEMSPISTGLGEIFQYSLESPGRDLTELRTIQDWMVKPSLRSVPGVAEVNSFGGYEKQYHILIRPDALVKYDLTLRAVFESVASNNINVGGGYILKSAEQLIVRGVGRIESMEQIKSIVLTTHDGVPVRVSDVADVEIGAAIRQGAVSQDGKGEAVIGIVMMLMGANSRLVVENVKQRLAAVEKTLPEDVTLKPFYDRADLVSKTIRTATTNLVEGAALVIVVLLLLLGNIRGAIIVALTIPLSMLFAMSMMVKLGIAGTLMSLGAIDFGLIVDGSVVLVENSLRHLAERRKEKSILHTILESCTEVGRPIIFGVGIIIVVYLPILTLEGIEGKLFRPMAQTVIFALLGSLILTCTLIPVLASLCLRGKISEKETFLIRQAKKLYGNTLRWCFRYKKSVLTGATVIVLIALSIFPFLGAEFVPRLDEGAMAISTVRLASSSLEESVRHTIFLEEFLLTKFPDEIDTIVSKTGSPEIATDPMGPHLSDIMIKLKPKDKWKRAQSKKDLEAKMTKEAARIPGLAYGFSQPIELRVNELISGVRSDVAIKIFGEDLEALRKLGEEVVEAVSALKGASNFKTQQMTGLPMLEIIVDIKKIARYGIKAQDVMEIVECIGGIEVSQVLEEQRRFALVLKLPKEASNHKDAIARLFVSAPHGERIPLGSLCDIREVEGPAEIRHQNGSRLTMIEGNVRGRDIGTFVEDVRNIFAKGKVKLATGYRLEFGGQFENLERARKKLFIVVPLALFLIFMLLFTTFNSLGQAILVFTGIPLAAVGGVFSLLLCGMPFSISAAVGFIALFGVAVLNGLVMVSYINKLRQDGVALLEAIHTGALIRLRPVLMTALVASLGFIPMAISTSEGAEVQRPLAIVVIGGLITSTILTLFVLPILYEMFERLINFGGMLRKKYSDEGKFSRR